jgi:hypothetical protein
VATDFEPLHLFGGSPGYSQKPAVNFST